MVIFLKSGETMGGDIQVSKGFFDDRLAILNITLSPPKPKRGNDGV